MLSNLKILVTNDDGINGEGLKALVQELSKLTKNIVVIAPLTNQSAVSQRLTLEDGMKLEEIQPLVEGVKTYTLSGTPTDCVKVGISYLNLDIDLVVSGMNNGLNTASDILYSGTLGACFEASINKVKSIGFSCERGEFVASKSVSKVFEYICQNKLLEKYDILNVNMPIDAKGIKMTIQGNRSYLPYYILENGLLYTKKKDYDPAFNQPENADIIIYHEGYISISALTSNRSVTN